MENAPELAMVELAPNDCWDLLRSAAVGRLAVIADGMPDIFPINFVVDHGTIVFRTAEGTKLAASTHRAPVAFEADGYDAQRGTAWSVVIKSHGESVASTEDLVDTLDLPLFPWQASPKPYFVRLVPTQVTGRRFTVTDPSTWSHALGTRTAAPE